MLAVVLVAEATGWVSQGGSRHRFLFLLDQDRLLLRWRLWACGQRSGVVQPPASVPGDHVHSRFAAAAPDRHGRPVGQRLVGTAIVVEGDPGADPGARRAAVGIGFQVCRFRPDRTVVRFGRVSPSLWQVRAAGDRYGLALLIEQLLPGHRQAVKEGRHRRLAVTPAALVGADLVVLAEPFVQVGLQLGDRPVELLAKSNAVELVQHGLVEALADSIRLRALGLGPTGTVALTREATMRSASSACVNHTSCALDS